MTLLINTLPYLALLAAGLMSGFLAGLIGIGGGFVTVPVLLFLLPGLGVDHDILTKVAVATSLAAMIPTAISTLLAQYRHGSLDIQTIKYMAPSAALGGVGGAFLMGHVSSLAVVVIFALYAGWFAKKLLISSPKKDVILTVPTVMGRLINMLPGWVAGVFIGGFSAMAGIGGSSLTISFLLSKGIDMRKASAVSSAVGLALALSSSATYVGNGSNYVLWVAMLFLSFPAFLTAPLGVKVAHNLPVDRIKKAFGVVLLLASGTALIRIF